MSQQCKSCFMRAWVGRSQDQSSPAANTRSRTQTHLCLKRQSTSHDGACLSLFTFQVKWTHTSYLNKGANESFPTELWLTWLLIINTQWPLAVSVALLSLLDYRRALNCSHWEQTNHCWFHSQFVATSQVWQRLTVCRNQSMKTERKKVTVPKSTIDWFSSKKLPKTLALVSNWHTSPRFIHHRPINKDCFY